MPKTVDFAAMVLLNRLRYHDWSQKSQKAAEDAALLVIQAIARSRGTEPVLVEVLAKADEDEALPREAVQPYSDYLHLVRRIIDSKKERV